MMPRCIISLALAFVAVTTACASEVVTLRGRAMGTTWSVRLVQPASRLEVEALQTRIAGRLEELEQQFSTYRARSELSRFNASASTDWQPVSAELVSVAHEARRISELTGGAYDVTVAALVRRWGFGAKGRGATLPNEDEIAGLRRDVGWRLLEVRDEPVALRKTAPGVTADFSSVAKGFASDAISALLVASGAARHVVQVGGDIKAAGLSANGLPWRLGIEQPQDGGGPIREAIAVSDAALSTSGDYRNFFVHEGRRFSHLIDPRSGWPVSNGLAAVSVVASTSARASGLATGLFVLGLEEGMALAKRERIACVFFVRVGDDFVRHATPEFETLVDRRSVENLATRR